MIFKFMKKDIGLKWTYINQECKIFIDIVSKFIAKNNMTLFYIFNIIIIIDKAAYKMKIQLKI